MKTLVIASHNNATLSPVTLAAVSAALKIGASFDIFVAGKGCAAVAEEAAKVDGVSAVLVADHDALAYQGAENLAATLQANAEGYSHIVAPATSVMKDALPRLAALLGVGQISDITGVNGEAEFVRPIYAGNVITVRTSAFDAAPTGAGTGAITAVDNAVDCGLSRVVSEEIAQSERPELASASIVVSGGRGVGSEENFALIEKLADRLNAALGASRAAVDAGFIGNDHQVGQTGKIVAPDLYVAVGISGAIQHLAGMQGSKVIVAINKDPDAPIYEVADYGLVGDLHDLVPELEAKLASVL